jgi:GTPase involved in cell partitioning and DNA repair
LRLHLPASVVLPESTFYLVHQPLFDIQVGDFAFTTLQPQLGVVAWKDKQLVAADIPGLITGAAENRGLGLAFLRHIERSKTLVFVVDMSRGQDGTSECKPYNQLKMLQVCNKLKHLCLTSSGTHFNVQNSILTF